MRISIIQTPRRQEVSAAVFDTMSKSKEVKPAATEKKPAVEVTMKQVEEKIEKALDEEVK